MGYSVRRTRGLGNPMDMQSYNFWQDLFDTYQSLADWIKALWLVVPPVFILGLASLLVRFLIARKQIASPGRLVYSIHRDGSDRLHIVSHVPPDEAPPALLLLDPPDRAGTIT